MSAPIFSPSIEKRARAIWQAGQVRPGRPQTAEFSSQLPRSFSFQPACPLCRLPACLPALPWHAPARAKLAGVEDMGVGRGGSQKARPGQGPAFPFEPAKSASDRSVGAAPASAAPQLALFLAPTRPAARCRTDSADHASPPRAGLAKHAPSDHHSLLDQYASMLRYTLPGANVLHSSCN
ncbi:uncharacterized protein PSFLO_00077 [Pseudozyma flocculosa]|uniref:Uncharacterized protein n=1 Tax=Pseudozyma flocculosa TaxID=84751 RepID=A0A5C3ESX2_9BASI|nr:uncharacterized protein PSFLO_00077 [Pseudozyma flocculosa]